MNSIRIIQKIPKTLLLIGLLFLIAGCDWMEGIQSTPMGDHTGTLISPDLEQNLTPSTVQTLQLFPIIEGSTWIYEYLGFVERGEVLWRVVETVVETRVVDGYYIAEIARTKEHLDGEIPENFLNTPDVGSTWVLVNGDHVYQLASPWEPELANAQLELILPPPEEGEGWYPNPAQRDEASLGELGFRQASEPYPQSLPNDAVYTCYNIGTQIEDGVQEGTFCETIGYVYKELKNFHRSLGYRVELIDFSLP
jgi:hypothetical protein